MILIFSFFFLFFTATAIPPRGSMLFPYTVAPAHSGFFSAARGLNSLRAEPRSPCPPTAAERCGLSVEWAARSPTGDSAGYSHPLCQEPRGSCRGTGRLCSHHAAAQS